MHHNFVITFLMLFFSFCTLSKNIVTEYKFLYGPSLSENQACEKAIIEAKKKAIAKESETLSSESVMFCDETTTTTNEFCKNYNAFWSSSNAIIKQFTVLKKKVGKDKETNLNYCEVSVSAILSLSKGRSDPNFDFFSKLNKNLFFEGETLSIFVETKTPMYINIFQWQLNNNAFNSNVAKIFPNKFDNINFVQNKINIPNNLNDKIKDYQFKISKSDKNNISSEEAEYILILATKNNINFRNNYQLGELKSIINEIDLSKRRERTHAYKIFNNKR